MDTLLNTSEKLLIDAGSVLFGEIINMFVSFRASIVSTVVS